MNPTLPPFVQELFDRGVDPLDDPRTREWLLDHPAAMAPFAALRDTLRRLPARRPASRPARRAWPWLAAAAALAATTLPFAFGAGVESGSTPQPATTAAVTTLPRPDLATAGGVLYSRVATTHVAGQSKRQRVEVFESARGAVTNRLDRREVTTRSTFLTLPGPTTPWTIASITERKAMLP